MAAPRQNAPHGPELEATEARQSRPAPGTLSMLVISTVVGLIVVAIIWAFFAGPLGRAPLKPHVQSAEQASSFSQPPPQAKMRPSPSTTGAPGDGSINQR
ncbi:MAG TPA: hypothetical protein VH353_07545 [Caulobacteraceae bacterium]|nr:hypothetical protein [Caulobacteraceae bacterium]